MVEQLGREGSRRIFATWQPSGFEAVPKRGNAFSKFDPFTN
jgi:hypothetical protein